jgi:hypothetical protein
MASFAGFIGIGRLLFGVAVVAGCSGSSGNGDLDGASDGGAPKGQGTGLGGGLAGAGGGLGAGTNTSDDAASKRDGGGTGLGSGTGPAGGGSECRMATGQPACDTCLTASCCAEVKGCNANASCNPLYGCLNGCGAEDEDCQFACLETNGAGKAPLQVVFSCAQQKCNAECS